jgi:hypothetical protein
MLANATKGGRDGLEKRWQAKRWRMRARLPSQILGLTRAKYNQLQTKPSPGTR